MEILHVFYEVEAEF